DALKEEQLDEFMPMLRKAIRFIVQNGPCSPQDRWEENAGYSPFTLAVEVAALLGAADIIEKKGDSGMADYLRETADIWNENIEEWTYAQDTELSKEMDVDGYYIRIAPPNIVESASKDEDIILIKNLPGRDHFKSTFIVSTGALALVRF